jgi:hypothetical protein
VARQRIGSSGRPKNQVALTFKERPKTRSTLFGKDVTAGLSKVEQDYFQIVDALNGKPFEPNMKQVSSFFIVQYEFNFNIKCIDYNWFNFSSTMKKVQDYLNIESNLELCRFLAESFVKYENVRKRLKLTEKFITVSTFKRAWILDELEGKSGQKFEGFY